MLPKFDNRSIAAFMNQKDKNMAPYTVVKNLERNRAFSSKLVTAGGRYFILKEFHHDSFRGKEEAAAFEAYFTPWLKLPSHPHIAELCQIVTEPVPALLIEYIAPDIRSFNSLEHYLKLSPPDLRQALQWTTMLCDALAFALERGISLHGNITPSNVLIGGDGRIKLTDFGIFHHTRSRIPVSYTHLRAHET